MSIQHRRWHPLHAGEIEIDCGEVDSFKNCVYLRDTAKPELMFAVGHPRRKLCGSAHKTIMLTKVFSFYEKALVWRAKPAALRWVSPISGFCNYLVLIKAPRIGRPSILQSTFDGSTILSKRGLVLTAVRHEVGRQTQLLRLLNSDLGCLWT